MVRMVMLALPMLFATVMAPSFVQADPLDSLVCQAISAPVYTNDGLDDVPSFRPVWGSLDNSGNPFVREWSPDTTNGMDSGWYFLQTVCATIADILDCLDDPVRCTQDAAASVEDLQLVSYDESDLVIVWGIDGQGVMTAGQFRDAYKTA